MLANNDILQCFLFSFSEGMRRNHVKVSSDHNIELVMAQWFWTVGDCCGCRCRRAVHDFITPFKWTKSMRGRFIMLFSFNKLLNSVFSCQCILHYDVMDVWLWCYYTCRIAFYCSSHLAGSVSSADIVLKNIQYDVGPISFPTSSLSRFPTWSRCRPDVVSNVEPFRYRPDVGPISFPTSNFCGFQTSARCRPDIVDDIWPTSSPRANMESARYQPTFADIGPIYFADIRLLSWPTFADIGPTSSLYGFQKSARHRVYIGQMSAWYRWRHLADIGPIYFADIRLLSWPTFADIGPTSSLYGFQTSAWHRVYIGQMSAWYRWRHLADIEPTCKHGVGPISADICRYRPDIISDIRPMSWPTFADIGPTSGRSFCAIWVISTISYLINILITIFCCFWYYVGGSTDCFLVCGGSSCIFSRHARSMTSQYGEDTC